MSAGCRLIFAAPASQLTTTGSAELLFDKITFDTVHILLPAETAGQAPLDKYLTQLGETLAAQLQPALVSRDASPQQQAAFARTERLAAALLSTLGTAARDALLQQTVAPVAAALLGPVQAGSAPPSAATCLADLVKGFGPEVMAVAAAQQEGRGRTTGLCFTGQPEQLTCLLRTAPASTHSSASLFKPPGQSCSASWPQQRWPHHLAYPPHTLPPTLRVMCLDMQSIILGHG